MTRDDMLPIAVERLHAQGHLLHSQMLQLAQGDESLMIEVRHRLLEDGIAVNQFGVVKLVSAEATAVPEADRSSNLIPAPQATVANLSAIAESQASLPVSPFDHAKPIGPEQNSAHEAHRVQPGAAGLALRYVLWCAGREEGPFPRDEIERRLAEGRLNPTDFVRIDSDDEWIPAAKALARTGPSPAGSADRKTAPGTRTPAEEIAVATSLAVSIAATARQAGRTHSSAAAQRQTSGATGSLCAGWNWLQRRCEMLPLRNGAALLAAVLGLWVFWNRPPAAQSISAEFHQCVMQLEAIANLKGTSSSEWQQFVDKKRPRIKELVESLESRANGDHPAERELYSAGERALLPMLREGVTEERRQKFYVHWHKYLEIREGTRPADLDVAGSAAHAGPRESAAPNPAISPGASASPTRASSAIPAGVPTNAPYAPPSTSPFASHAAPSPIR